MEFMQNRYVRLTALTILIGVMFWVIIWITLMLAGLNDFPVFLQMAISFLGAGLLVYKFFAPRVF